MSSTINRLVMHHSAGSYKVSAVDKAHYHRIIGGDGIVVSGNHPISANAIGRRLTSGNYAAHTLNLNGGSIGLSMACMAGAVWNRPRECDYFPTKAQVEAFIREAARLIEEHDIVLDRQHVLSHAEVQGTLGVTQRGKWDFDYDPFQVLDSRDPVVIGDLLRESIREQLEQAPVVAPEVTRRTIRRGSYGADVKRAQELLTRAGYDTKGVDGSFGPNTEIAAIRYQKAKQLSPDGIIGPATWKSLEN